MRQTAGKRRCKSLKLRRNSARNASNRDGQDVVAVLSDEFEPVSDWTVSLSFIPRKDHAIQQVQRRG